jgi:hypothetical protein
VDSPPQRTRRSLVFFFQRQDAAFRAGGIHRQPYATHDLDGPALHQPLVALQQWITLGAVGNDRVHRGAKLHVRGETSPASAYHSRNPDCFDEILTHALPLKNPQPRQESLRRGMASQ